MKKILILMIGLVFAFTAYSQDTNNSITWYTAGGLSIANSPVGGFEAASFPSVEVGGMYENIAFAGVFGRNNLVSTPTETIDNYWYEGKIMAYRDFDYVDGYILLGVGAYVSGGTFIEYGFGISKGFTGNFGGFLQASNWDGVTYVTPGIYYTFN